MSNRTSRTIESTAKPEAENGITQQQLKQCEYNAYGAGLYYVDSDGNRMPGNVFSVGSGSLYAYGVLDSGYHWDMTDEEAYELGRRAIYHATHRDAYSGGIVRVYHIKEGGWVRISEQDSKDLHYAYAEGKTLTQ
ncbi:Proteasome subunit beta type-5 [Portunus trituberculatus]|uniref:proteasome endopeptidase complex n=1 Tax=Portunus trituberculatus TaxID=210409 RepID=A0A5B7INJ1_PORTR|nr:Proteasome subunit beta type-5 [Portunus trituberculatus]